MSQGFSILQAIPSLPEEFNVTSFAQNPPHALGFDAYDADDAALNLNRNLTNIVSNGNGNNEQSRRLQQLEEYVANIVEPNMMSVEKQLNGFGSALTSFDNRLAQIASASDDSDIKEMGSR